MRVRVTPLLFGLLCCAGLWAEPLELGQSVDLVIPGGEAKDLDVTVAAAGMLTVVTRGSGGDVLLQVCDTDNQPLPDGQADMDIGENLANEQLVSALPYAETWRVRVHNNAEEVTKISLVAGFVNFPAVAREPDKDGRPSKAGELTVGQPIEDTLDAPGYDLADWYAVTAQGDGRLVFFTEGDEALDVVLMVYTGEAFDEIVAQSDQDLQGSTSNEGVIVPVKAGQVYYLQVAALPPSVGAYRLGSSFIAF